MGGFNQLSLLTGETVKPDYTPTATIQEKFELFHKLNPHVYGAFRDLALQLANRGRSRIGVGMLTEILRWNYMMHTEDPNSDFKISNNYRSRYARLLMRQEPELDGIFCVKELRSD
jgi:hypothetical protein